MPAAKHLLRYLAGTTDHGITYNQGGFFFVRTGATIRTTAALTVRGANRGGVSLRFVSGLLEGIVTTMDLSLIHI